MSRTGASTPEVTKTAAAASSSVLSLRRASARLRGAACPAPPSLSFTAPFPPLLSLSNGTAFPIVIGTRFRLLMMPEQGPTTKPRIVTTLHPQWRKHGHAVPHLGPHRCSG